MLMERTLYLQKFDNIPIHYDKEGRFDSMRSRSLFILLFEENVKTYPNMPRQIKEILLKLIDYIRDSPILRNIGRLELIENLNCAGVTTRSQLMYWFKQGIKMGFLDIPVRPKQGHMIMPIVLHAIPKNWDASEVQKALMSAYPLEWEVTG
jgi:hypothetical protein